MSELLEIYRERNGNPMFWGEPVNALTNASFLVAAAFALHFAVQRQAMTPMTLALTLLAATIGVGSFLFHTAVSPLTMWLDVIPIALFQVLFLWLASREMLGWNVPSSLGLVMVVLGLSFAFMPIHQPLNGSLFYFPSLIAVSLLGWVWLLRGGEEPSLLLMAAGCFALAITARSTDWIVALPMGSHFLWHLLNGVVVYLALRAWIVHLSTSRAAGL